MCGTVSLNDLLGGIFENNNYWYTVSCFDYDTCHNRLSDIHKIAAWNNDLPNNVFAFIRYPDVNKMLVCQFLLE